ncbi:hypothetical protein BDF21DRAFT_152598 [Thamnidium elegans]|nr:hypothetical protein BDF21DRAFT_152598 [Thamnidium elegans]
MDTAEIRIHTYNRTSHDSSIPVRWNTKVCDLDHDLQQLLLLQPNRSPEYVPTLAWNDHLSQTLVNWVSDKRNRLYDYKLPTKGGLHNEVNTFLLHHPSIPSALPAVVPDFSPSPATRDIQSDAKGTQSVVWTARPPAKAVQPDAKDVCPQVRSEPVGKSIIPTVKDPAPSHPKTTSTAAKTTTLAVKSVTPGNTSSHHTPGVLTASADPPVAPAGIHPERMAMIGGNVPLPSTSGMDTIERKRGRDSEDEGPSAKKLGKMPVSTDIIMEDTQGSKDDLAVKEIDDASKNIETAVPNDASSSSSNPVNPDESTSSLASEFANSFNAFFTNALQKFEDEILNIKF